MGAIGYDRFTLTEVNELLQDLDWQPLGADSPQAGEVIKYRDGSWAFVGTSSRVSYGPREEMESVAKLFPRGRAQIEEGEEDVEREE